MSCPPEPEQNFEGPVQGRQVRPQMERTMRMGMEHSEQQIVEQPPGGREVPLREVPALPQVVPVQLQGAPEWWRPASAVWKKAFDPDCIRRL